MLCDFQMTCLDSLFDLLTNFRKHKLRLKSSDLKQKLEEYKNLKPLSFKKMSYKYQLLKVPKTFIQIGLKRKTWNENFNLETWSK